MLSRLQCQTIIFNLGLKFGVSPKLIATRLLSSEDKQYMLEGLLTIEALECAVEAWKASGTPDHAHGNTEPLKKGGY
jgi:hypothetical protein